MMGISEAKKRILAEINRLERREMNDQQYIQAWGITGERKEIYLENIHNLQNIRFGYNEALNILNEECSEEPEEEMENETVVETPKQISETSAMLRSVIDRAKAHKWEIHYEIPERKIVANWEAMKPGDVIALHTYSGYAVHGILLKSYRIGHYYLKIRLLGECLFDEFFEEVGGWIVEKPDSGILANTGYHCVPWDAVREISAVETPTSEELDWKKKVIDAWEGYEEEEDEH